MDLSERNKFFLDVLCEQTKGDIIPKGKMADVIVRAAYSHGRGAETSFNDWLEWMIEFFTYEPCSVDRLRKRCSTKHSEDETYYTLMTSWLQHVTDDWSGEHEELLGMIYESVFKSASKASSIGQFFTPMSLCRVMARMVCYDRVSDSKNAIRSLYDCACGSSRTILAALKEFEDDNEHTYICTAGDVDHTSVMMSALNLMAVGAAGFVIRQDALALSRPMELYMVNPLGWPIDTGFRSLANIPVCKAIEHGIVTQEGDQYNLLTVSYYKRILESFRNLGSGLEMYRQLNRVIEEVRGLQ